MIIDTSALLAILFDEPDGPALLRRIAEAPIRLMSSAHAVEAWIVADRHANPAKGPALDALLETLGIDIVPVTVQHARLARTAYHTYGRGRHPAGSHFGDCCAYALAKATDLPRLFKAAGHRYARPSRPSASRLSLGIDQLWYDRNNIQGLSLWPHTVWQAPIIAA